MGKTYVVIVPDGLESIDPHALALLLETDVYSASQLLRSPHPRIVCTCDHEAEATAMSDRLGELGMPCFCCGEEPLRQGYAVQAAKSLTIGPGGWVFRFADGRDLCLEPARVWLMIEFRLDQRMTTETTTRAGRLHRLLGARAVRSRHHEETTQFLLHIFSEDTPCAVEIAANDFDFSGAGMPLSYCAAMNFRALVHRLRAAAPSATYDDGLCRRPPSPVPVGIERSLSTNRRRKRHTEREDNHRAVREIATLLYLHHRPTARTAG